MAYGALEVRCWRECADGRTHAWALRAVFQNFEVKNQDELSSSLSNLLRLQWVSNDVLVLRHWQAWVGVIKSLPAGPAGRGFNVKQRPWDRERRFPFYEEMKKKQEHKQHDWHIYIFLKFEYSPIKKNLLWKYEHPDTGEYLNTWCR